MVNKIRILIAITSYNDDFYTDGLKTGLFVNQVLQPFEIFREAGYEVDFISETGKYGIDEHSTRPQFLSGPELVIYEDKYSQFNQTLEKIKSPPEVKARNYQVFFASGGPGALFDYPNARGLQAKAEDIYSRNGIIASVCHGGTIFDGLNDKRTGRPILYRKSITGFSDLGGKVLRVEDLLLANNLLTVEQIAKKCQAKYLGPIDPFDDFSLTDGRIITGANPASSKSTAIRVVNCLESLPDGLKYSI